MNWSEHFQRISQTSDFGTLSDDWQRLCSHEEDGEFGKEPRPFEKSIGKTTTLLALGAVAIGGFWLGSKFHP